MQNDATNNSLSEQVVPDAVVAYDLYDSYDDSDDEVVDKVDRPVRYEEARRRSAVSLIFR